LSREFELIKVNTASSPPWARQLLRGAGLAWTPTLVVSEPAGTQIRRRVGFGGPSEFVADLCVGLGIAALRRADFTAAFDWFDRASSGSHAGGVAPEAIYWSGIAAYKRDRGSKQFLREQWVALEKRYPESDWWSRADVFPTE